MKVVHGMHKLPLASNHNLYLALGNFDGVHLGHQKIIRTAVEKAQKNNGASGALVFDPHPSKIISPEKDLQLISDLHIKSELLEKLGLDYMVVEPFSLEVAKMSPEDFLNKYLKGLVKVRGVVAGYNYSFGHRARGSSAFLAKWGKTEEIEVTVCPPVKMDRVPVSSSMVRGMIAAGRVDKAAQLLDYYFFRHGKVVPGRGRGKALGFPTANLAVASDLILPGEGVYFTLVKKDNSLLTGATNVGRRPTFGYDQLSVEVNILDFREDLYYRQMTVYFIKKIRDEIAFNRLEELKFQMDKDIRQVRRMSRHAGIDSCQLMV